MKKLFALIILTHMLSDCVSQESYLRHYSTNEGLPSSETYWAMQDRSGYIWIASDMGVSRFDGYGFRVFTTADGLTDNTVFRFYEDYVGRMWFYTFSGKLCYYYHDTIYGRDFSVNKNIRDFLGTDLVTGINLDQHDTIMMSTTKGLLKIIPEYKNDHTSWNKLELVTGKKSFLLAGGYATVERIKDSTLLMMYTRDKAPVSYRLPVYFNSFIEPAEYRHEGLLIFYDYGTLLIDTGSRTHIFAGLAPLISSYQQGDGSIWLGEKHGGAHLIVGSDLSKPLKSFLKSFSVTCVMKDRENGYWFTTLEDGLFYLPSSQFTYFEKTAYPQYLKFPSFSENLLKMVGDNKVLGLTSKKIYSVADANVGQASADLSHYFPNQLETTFWNMYIHHSGKVWISSTTGIHIYDSLGGRIIGNIYMPVECHENDSRQIIEDDQHDLWSLNHSSLVKIDQRTEKIRKIVLIASRAEAACPDYQGRIMVGTVNGLYRLSGDSLEYMGDQNQLFKNRVVDLQRYDKKIICATRGAGLIILSEDSTYQITMANGLRSNMCRSVYVDSDHVIWLATNSGLNSIQLSEHPFHYTITSFSTADGLLSNDNDQVLKSGKMIWLLSKKGITAFDPEVAVHNSITPPVYITRVQVNNVSRSPKSVKVLDYATNFIEIDFVGLTYRNAGKQYYKYKLQGYDTSVTLTQNPFVQFTKLPPGDYTFEVSCINNSGIESENPAVLSFQVSAPFYQKWWFSILILLLVIILVIFASFIYIRGIRRRELIKTEINTKIANLELQALRAQMNPHFIFNCLNAIQDFILKNDSESAKYYLSSFSKLIRKTLNNSQKPSILLADEMDFLNLYLGLEKMRFSDRFSYQIIKNQNVDNEFIGIPVMILQPFIENSIRHGKIGSLPRPGELTITFSTDGVTLVCRIVDNGIGVNQSVKGKDAASLSEPHALDIIRSRIRTINEINKSAIRFVITDRSDINPDEQGTEVTIYIPIQNYL